MQRIIDVLKQTGELIYGLALFAVLILNFERGYGLSEEIVGIIIGGMLIGAGWRALKQT